MVSSSKAMDSSTAREAAVGRLCPFLGSGWGRPPRPHRLRPPENHRQLHHAHHQLYTSGMQSDRNRPHCHLWSDVDTSLVYPKISLPVARSEAVFSFPIALLLAEISQAIINAVGFIVGRKLLQKSALVMLDRWKYAKATLLAVNSAGQFKVVLLLQLSPFPSEVTQYIIGVPKEITFLPSFVASMIGTLPGIVLSLVFGRSFSGISAVLKGDFKSIPTAQLIVGVVSLVAAIIFVIGVESTPKER